MAEVHPASKDWVPFVVGDLVTVPFGEPVRSTKNGIIQSFTMKDGQPQYVVQFTDWKLSNDTNPTGHFHGAALQPRDRRTVAEVIAEAIELRKCGNAFYKGVWVRFGLWLCWWGRAAR